MSVVYVIHQTHQDRDYSSAREYGAIQFILDLSDRPSIQPELCLNKIDAVLKKFNPDTDYIVWSGGDPIAPLLVGIILRRYVPAGKNFKFLRWERRRNEHGHRSYEGFYVPTNVQPF